MDCAGTGAKYECLLFDMDDTLYPLSFGLNLACRKNIQDYMLHHLQIEESQVPKMCMELYKEYGTTMAGLKALGFKFDNDEFHSYVHGRLPYEILRPDPMLKNLLLSIPQRKIIFTNADEAHVEKVLSKLGLEDCFEGVICFETLNPPLKPTDHHDEKDITVPSTVIQSMGQNGDGCFSETNSETDTIYCADPSNANSNMPILCKPSMEAIKAAIKLADINPRKTIFFDDSTRNIAAGKAAGLHTVIVGSSVLVPGADHALRSIHNIKEALPEIWEGGDDSKSVLASTTVETIVLA
uniref:Uncharacterized protein C24B11.05 n=1 Tax=Elaeis guineensis var. tenera TaxID=51953 RepID=A0A6I9QJF6_ELAGV|nr:uncharacterized protein C24B11.05 [Elaeis guineensis]XP_010909515.1 uncharacterized protein C24B11.05 [Elaeis guineensis]XP_010909524.1 uncharacterized protein C24B11.05 [Elaeis guineensis]